MRNPKRKLNFKRIFLFLLLPLFFVILSIFAIKNSDLLNFSLDYTKNNLSVFNNCEYEIIKIDQNPNYLGIGQEIIDNKDGYTTTFTTTSENQKTYLEYKQNGSSSWSNKPYWENSMETDGCGITAISIILSGYNRDTTPEDLREIYYPVLKSDQVSYELQNSYGIKNSGFLYDSVHLESNYIESFLETNRPILICVWNKPHANRWTTASHYMVLLASDGNGMVYVSNPNGLPDTSKSSGWYKIDEVVPYIAKALFIEDYD